MFPENVGYSIGEEAGQQYYMMEIHYDNPAEIEGLKFETGVEFYYTDELRWDILLKYEYEQNKNLVSWLI